MRATSRWALADLRTHRGQALSIVCATAGITMALLLSVALLVYAANPWERAFATTRGAHVWLRTDAVADTGALAGLDGVTAVSGPFRTVLATVRHGADQATLGLRATGPVPPKAARPQLVGGQWLDGRQTDAVVLEKTVAAALWAATGDTLRVTVAGRSRSLHVVGVAETAEPGFGTGGAPGIGWANPALVAELGRAGGRTGQTVGLRLADPADADFTVQRAVALVGPERVVSVSTWRETRAEAEGDNHMLGLILGLFGLGALLAAAVAVTGGVGSRVLAHVQDISVLKVVGFTPAQIVRMFLIQHAALATAGVLAGTAATELLGTRVPGRLGQAMALWRTLPEHAWAVPVTATVTVLVFAAATVLASWRAGRIPPVPAVRQAAAAGRGLLPRAAGAALGMRVPPALVLGWRGAVRRPRRSAAAVARLALPLFMITLALGAWATVGRLGSDPAAAGLAERLTARPVHLSDPAARRALARQPGIAVAHPTVELPALAPGQTATVVLRGVGTAAHPYPFVIADGRAPAGPDEAVAGQGLLDALHAHVGQWVRLTVGGTPHIVHIVGRNIEARHSGRVVSMSYDALRRQDATVTPDFYSLVLRSGARPAAVRAALTAPGAAAFEVRTVADPTGGLAAGRGVVLGAIAVLALIGLGELSTAVAVSVREHSRDLWAYRTVGLTPRQSVAAVATTTALITLCAAGTGIALGVPTACRLIDLQADAVGMGAGVARPPWWAALLLVAGAAVSIATAASVIPARRAVRRREGRLRY
ncbi:putative ABC transport system permease protein [Actinacidiphila alni]|uniref:Putative ABC transport system permease protein n=1 Tax=Actinacidiphila alni TaxID=380248 RepID=A0A1I2J3D2_9ACTN|nr:ABC transporter permease [Actinacidiphila alni]SFF47757.1 putative ABC transport system permease protein [Actinacidiphila alni]